MFQLLDMKVFYLFERKCIDRAGQNFSSIGLLRRGGSVLEVFTIIRVSLCRLIKLGSVWGPGQYNNSYVQKELLLPAN